MTLMNWPEMASTGEAILFGCVAVFMIACALGVLFFKKAVYCAICMVGVMLGLAILYLMHGAAFLGTVQVVVYTGAIMVLFLFVIMMIGLSASDNYARQSRGRIVTSVLMALGLGAILIGAIARSRTAGSSASLSDDPYSNAPITDLAATLFSRYWFSMELAGILLITAAIGAMLLTHSDQLGPVLTQRTTAEAKMRAFKASGRRIGQLPAPGVYAHSNAVDVPALSGETHEPVEESVPRVLRVRGLDRVVGQVEPEVAQSLALAKDGSLDHTIFDPAHPSTHERSQAWGMPGAAAPSGLKQPQASQTADEGKEEE